MARRIAQKMRDDNRARGSSRGICTIRRHCKLRLGGSGIADSTSTRTKLSTRDCVARDADDDEEQQGQSAIAEMSSPPLPDRVNELLHRIDDELHQHDVPAQVVAPGSFRLPIFASLRARFAMDDQLFDTLYPHWVRMLSDTHWTPVSVAIRAVQLLLPGAGDRIVDIGSGAGKFCTVAGMLHRSAIFYGVEQRIRLIHAAQKLGRRLQVDNVHYIHGDIASVNLADFEGAYMFNPFGEHVLE